MNLSFERFTDLSDIISERQMARQVSTYNNLGERMMSYTGVNESVEGVDCGL